MVSGVAADCCSWLRDWRCDWLISVRAFWRRWFALPEFHPAVRSRRVAVCQERRRTPFLSLSDAEDLIGGHPLEVVFTASRSQPAHVQFPDFRRLAESETQPPALLRGVTGAHHHMPQQLPPVPQFDAHF